MNTQNQSFAERYLTRNPSENDLFQVFSPSLQYVIEHYTRQPSTLRMAQLAGMDDAQFQSAFTDWVGMSPQRFVQAVTRENALRLLKQGTNSWAATFALGLSSPTRLHDLMVNTDGMSPAQVRQLGAGLLLHWGVCQTSLGATFVAFTLNTQLQPTVCKLLFGEASALPDEGQVAIAKDWPAAQLLRNDPAAAQIANTVVQRDASMPLRLRGTGFQIRVWQALLAIPEGALASYGAIARALGKPKASRAVGTAVGDNPISVLIPCHRVIQQSGALGGYAWGLERKIVLLGQEFGRPSHNQTARKNLWSDDLL